MLTVGHSRRSVKMVLPNINKDLVWANIIENLWMYKIKSGVSKGTVQCGESMQWFLTCSLLVISITHNATDSFRKASDWSIEMLAVAQHDFWANSANGRW